MNKLPVSVSAALLLAACDGEAQTPQPNSPHSQSSEADNRGRQESNAGQSDLSAVQELLGAAGGPPRVDPTAPITDVLDRSPAEARLRSLKRGVYGSASGNDCPPAMATLMIYDGKGFNGRNHTKCNFTVDTADSNLVRGYQVCADPADGISTSEPLTVEVLDADTVRITRRARRTLYKLCPNERLSDWQ